VGDEHTARLDEARATWPGLSLTPERFLELHREAPADEALHLPDLFLATACAEGDARALALLDAQFLSAVPAFVQRIDRAPAFAEEVRQILRTRLLVGTDGGRPVIGEYAGRGALKSWLHVAATRVALRLKRGTGRERELGEAEADRILATPDPELAFIKHRAREDFRLAFQAALAGLQPEERHLLRLHYLDRLTLQQIGALDAVDKSTISRRLAVVRQSLLEETQRLLRERLRLGTTDLDSLMNLVQSSLDVSIEAFLKAR
jgi:RNA polymerase sigma-70 factor, ECF subfamily